MKKIVFFDIDGTLLNHEKEIPSSTKLAIEELKNNDVYVAIATGRAPFMFTSLREELGVDSFVSFNGQYVMFEGKVIYENPLGQKELTMLYEQASTKNFPMVFMNEKEMKASENEHPFISKSLGSLKHDYPEVDLTFKDKNKIYQALLFCEENEEVPFIPKDDAYHFIRWHDYSCDVLPGGGSKAVGVKKIVEASGLKLENSFAFGDGLNDIEMIKEVGIGVSMGNGVLPLKEIADYVTDNVDENGIYNGLKHLGLI
ncbi:Cof-type HAD-IIB family hydrolase [Virgibacillus halodenitrificans]|uniref:Cof-type HAD-IIB family hydrolase n=1 Tax=Virgibacillus halodenitrificans TaxID=1482 RepID=UPI000761D61E